MMPVEGHGTPLLVKPHPNDLLLRMFPLLGGAFFSLLGIYFSYISLRWGVKKILSDPTGGSLFISIEIVFLFFMAAVLMIQSATVRPMELYSDRLVPNRIPPSAIFDPARRFIPFTDITSCTIIMWQAPDINGKTRAHCRFDNKGGGTAFVVLTTPDEISLLIKTAEKNGVKCTQKEYKK